MNFWACEKEILRSLDPTRDWWGNTRAGKEGGRWQDLAVRGFGGHSPPWVRYRAIHQPQALPPLASNEIRGGLCRTPESDLGQLVRGQTSSSLFYFHRKYFLFIFNLTCTIFNSWLQWKKNRLSVLEVKQVFWLPKGFVEVARVNICGFYTFATSPGTNPLLIVLYLYRKFITRSH